MKKIAPFLLISVFFVSACSENKSEVEIQTSVSEGENASVVKVSGVSTQFNSDAPVGVPMKSTQTAPKESWFNSEVFEMVDGFGNRLITRKFKDHPRVTSVTVLVTPKGEQTVEVFGQNGERREISAYMSEKALNGTGDEIADIAGIFQTKRQAPKMPEINFNQAIVQTPEKEAATENVEATEETEKTEKEPTLSAVNSKNELKSETVPATETGTDPNVLKNH